MAGGAAEVHQPAFGEHDDRAAVGERELVDRADLGRLDVHLLAPAGLHLAVEPGHVDLQVEVADVADDRVVLHLRHVLAGDDVAAAGGGDEDVARAAASSMVVTS